MIRLALIAWLALCGVAHAQLSGGLMFPGPGMPASAGATYSGPNDAVSGAAVFYSCARTLNLANASTSTNLCDLVAVTGGAAVCTLRGTPSGFVDLAASYCAGTTPAAACAAASGGSCKVTKAYNQVAPGTNDATNATLGSMPALTFNALGGLPGMTCTNAASSALTTTGTVTQALPWTINAVAERTGNFTTTGGVFGENASGNNDVQFTTSTNTIGLHFGATLGTQTASDSAFHSLQGAGSASANQSIMVVDNTASAGITGTAVGVAQPMRLCRSSGSASSMTGIIMEAGLWNSAFNSTQYGLMNTNQHSAANGYNF